MPRQLPTITNEPSPSSSRAVSTTALASRHGRTLRVAGMEPVLSPTSGQSSRAEAMSMSAKVRAIRVHSE